MPCLKKLLWAGQLSEAEKEYKSLRKQVQEKIVKFATRVPIFMYLTDYRERSLKDVITQPEPGLFKKVTGLTVNDVELLVSLGVFNSFDERRGLQVYVMRVQAKARPGSTNTRAKTSVCTRQ